MKLSSLISQYGIPENIVNLIEAEESNSYGEIDIGQCIGNCSKYQILMVSADETVRKDPYFLIGRSQKVRYPRS